MGKAKDRRKDKGAFDSDFDDGIIEKPRFEDPQRNDITSFKREVTYPKPAINSGWKEGDVVGCPDKSKMNDTPQTTRGTVFALFGSEALVLCYRGFIHKCFVSELSLAKEE